MEKIMSIRKTLFGGAAVATGVVVSVLTAFAPMPAGAAQDHFNCRASALRLNLPLGQEVEPLTANAAYDPCRQDFESLVSFGDDLGIATGTLVARTNDDPQHLNSSTKVQKLKLTNLLDLVNLRVKAIRSHAHVISTANGKCKLRSSSSLVGAVIQGQEYASLDTPLDVNIKLLGLVVAKLHLNATLGGKHPTIGKPDATKITQRAVWLQVTDAGLQEVLDDLIVGEAKTGTVGHPCA
jgi:hypothetical protein